MDSRDSNFPGWDTMFKTRRWGRYPPEDLVRFVGRNYKNQDRSLLHALELGCGPGANLWFLHREGFQVSGIDGSNTAIKQAYDRLVMENRHINPNKPDLTEGNFINLTWPSSTFDLIIDIHAIYANDLAVIKKTISEALRVLKPGGRFFSKCWGRNTTGYSPENCFEPGTIRNVPSGPCQGMGISHFFAEEEIRALYSQFNILNIDRILRTDFNQSVQIEEYLIECQKEL